MDNDVVIIGAGPAGLATAGSLALRGMQARVIDAAADVGASWRAHYDRLHLHVAGVIHAQAEGRSPIAAGAWR